MAGEAGRPGSDATGSDPTAPAAVDPRFESELDEERLYEMVVDSASECYVVVDERNRVVFTNRAVEDILGYEPCDVVGERLTELIPPEYRTDHLTAFARYLRTGERTLDWEYLEIPGLHRDGHQVPLLVTFHEFTHEGDHFFVGVLRDNTERIERRERFESEKAFVESVFDALPDVVYAFDTSGDFLRWNDRANEVTGYTDEEIRSLNPLDFVPERDHGRVAESLDRVMDDGEVETIESALVTKDGTEIPYEFTGAPIVEDGEIIGETGVGRDVSERKRREEQLQRLDELNTVIRSVDQALVEASTREEIEAAVCDRLVTEGGYVGAVVCTDRGPDEDFETSASAGVSPTLLERGTTAFDDADVPLPVRAVRSGSVQVATGLQEADTGAWRQDAREQGYDAVAAVPLVQSGRVFGVLGIYAAETDAFERRERTILAELGEGVGNAIQHSLTQRMLYADTVTEVELRTTSSDVTLVALSAEVDCRIELIRALSYGDDVLLYLSVTGANPERVVAAAESLGVQSVEYFGTHSGEHSFQFVVEKTITTELSTFGARAVSGEAEGGVGRLTVQFPPSVDVRTFLDDIQSQYPETELVGRREVDRSLQTPAALRRELAAEMTEKQQAALEAAYFAGYFEWPSRVNNAVDVADMLGIAPQTFHQHLRVALAKLLRAFFRESAAENIDDATST